MDEDEEMLASMGILGVFLITGLMVGMVALSLSITEDESNGRIK